ncbi:PREDICTED: threonine aspartase 1, partial [Gekko japonicus]|uniref:Threonine aspartase 1 n=1 Tax=Gekko japonicus TaxID=146911 RepID=A0ABM1KBQ4_GEKJA
EEEGGVPRREVTRVTRVSASVTPRERDAFPRRLPRQRSPEAQRGRGGNVQAAAAAEEVVTWQVTAAGVEPEGGASETSPPLGPEFGSCPWRPPEEEEEEEEAALARTGAGYHSESKAKEYKHVCKRACRKDSPFTNAGMGSNLNLLGEIECDASIMDGKSLNFGAVGALSGIKNPVSVANRLLCEGQKGKLSAGRIPPCFLVGEGAFRWAVDHGIPACPPGVMATRLSLAAFKRNKRKLELAEKVETDLFQLKKRRQSSEKLDRSVQDAEPERAGGFSRAAVLARPDDLPTVLPPPLGAALYGCGCWAENTGIQNPYSTAVSTSGCGEHLVRTLLARECSCALQNEDAHQALLETMQNKFISSPFLANEDGVLGGVIVLRSCRCSAEANSSQDKQSLLGINLFKGADCILVSLGMIKAQLFTWSDSVQVFEAATHISRLPPGAVAGQSVAIEGGVCRLESPAS